MQHRLTFMVRQNHVAITCNPAAYEQPRGWHSLQWTYSGAKAGNGYIWTHQLLRHATGPHVARSHDCTFRQPCEQDKGLGWYVLAATTAVPPTMNSVSVPRTIRRTLLRSLLVAIGQPSCSWRSRTIITRH